MNILTKKKNRGFTVLFAVIVSALVLAIGISIANITLKQIRISSLGRESQIAFYGADSGAECIMYYDLMGENIFGTSSDSEPTTSVIRCFGEEFAVSFDGGVGLSGTTTIDMQATAITPSICANVQIGKHDTNSDGYSDKTVILSRGYNMCGTGISDASRLLERGLRITY